MQTHDRLDATIIMETGLHIGAEKSSLPADSLLRRDSSGRLVVTGRALGGCLRSIAERLAPRLGFASCNNLKGTGKHSTPCQCPVCRLFGERYPDENTTGGNASKLWFFDAVLSNESDHTHIRDGVGIEDTTAVAARNIKFNYEVLPSGTQFPFRLEWKETLTEDDSLLLAAALAEWVNGRGQLGGRSARGLGAFRLEGLRSGTMSLDTKDALMRYLRSNDQASLFEQDGKWYKRALDLAIAKREKEGPKSPKDLLDAAARGFVEITFELVFESQALTNDPLVAALSGYDHAPLVETLWTADSSIEQPVLSGSSLRGALRARAARIVRTLGSEQVCDPLARSDDLPNASCETRLGSNTLKEVLEEELCPGCRLFGSQMGGSRLWVRDARYMNTANTASWQAQDFLAIDRFTGGGQDHAKFDAAGLCQPRFHTSIVLNAPRGWELGWLALLMRDLAEGELVIGFGGAKGFGSTRAETVRWKFGFFEPWDIPGSPYQSGEPSGVYQLVTRAAPEDGWLPEDLRKTAEKWLQEFQAMIGFIETPTEAQTHGGQDA